MELLGLLSLVFVNCFGGNVLSYGFLHGIVMGYGVKWCFLSFANGESLWVSVFFKENKSFSSCVNEFMVCCN